MNGEEAGARLREALVDSARHHLMAERSGRVVPPGGVDSSALVGLLAEVHDAPVCTVNLGFDVRISMRAASRAKPHALRLGASRGADSGRRDPRSDSDALRSLDQPSIDGLNSYFVSEAR